MKMSEVGSDKSRETRGPGTSVAPGSSHSLNQFASIDNTGATTSEHNCKSQKKRMKVMGRNSGNE